MKKCPVCNRAYNDPTLNFCLEDGATLIVQTGGFGQTQPQNFVTASQMQGRKKSNPLVWIVGVLGVLIVIGGIGAVSLIALIAAGGNNGNNGKRTINSNGGGYGTNFKVSNDASNSSLQKGENIDFTRWGERKTAMGETKLAGDEFQVSALKNGYYYVVIASSKFEDKYLTNDATVKVTTHSVTGNSPSLGYGIIVNSDVDPLKSDYAFLIRSDNQTFRIVRHQSNEEETVTKWTFAPQIRTGTQTNQLEVRSADTKLAFYINGQLATSVTDENGSDQGIVGLYTSDTAPIGFSNLQVIKN
ncbi:MAG: hypothetical protein ABI954_05755 [Pyrinomonadaceae bacterium]